MDPIRGVSLESYASLCAAMARTGTDTAAQIAIAAEGGLDEPTWQAAKDGWTARMTDPAHQGRVAMAFYPLYSAAQAASRGGSEPLSLETYARIVNEYSFEKDAHGVRVEVSAVLARYGLDLASWSEITGYWTPKVNDMNDPAARLFRELSQAESDRIFGTVRVESAPAANVAPNEPRATPSPDAPVTPQSDSLIDRLLLWSKSLMG
jgi:hypothetical protein